MLYNLAMCYYLVFNRESQFLYADPEGIGSDDGNRNRCLNKQTCGECIGAGKECAFCTKAVSLLSHHILEAILWHYFSSVGQSVHGNSSGLVVKLFACKVMGPVFKPRSCHNDFRGLYCIFCFHFHSMNGITLKSCENLIQPNPACLRMCTSVSHY